MHHLHGIAVPAGASSSIVVTYAWGYLKGGGVIPIRIGSLEVKIRIPRHKKHA
jgi:hypothetical protein